MPGSARFCNRSRPRPCLRPLNETRLCRAPPGSKARCGGDDQATARSQPSVCERPKSRVGNGRVKQRVSPARQSCSQTRSCSQKVGTVRDLWFYGLENTGESRRLHKFWFYCRISEEGRPELVRPLRSSLSFITTAYFLILLATAGLLQWLLSPVWCGRPEWLLPGLIPTFGPVRLLLCGWGLWPPGPLLSPASTLLGLQQLHRGLPQRPHRAPHCIGHLVCSHLLGLSVRLYPSVWHPFSLQIHRLPEHYN